MWLSWQCNLYVTYHKTQLNESGSAIGFSEVLQQSENITVRANEELNIFFVEIIRAVVAAENESDRAIYELEACVPQSDGSERCYGSNIT